MEVAGVSEEIFLEQSQLDRHVEGEDSFVHLDILLDLKLPQDAVDSGTGLFVFANNPQHEGLSLIACG